MAKAAKQLACAGGIRALALPVLSCLHAALCPGGTHRPGSSRLRHLCAPRGRLPQCLKTCKYRNAAPSCWRRTGPESGARSPPISGTTATSKTPFRRRACRPGKARRPSATRTPSPSIESIARNVCLALLRRKRAYRSALSDFAVNAQPATWTQHADTHIIVHGKVRYRNDRLRGMLVVRLDDDWERMVPVSPDGAFTFPILS